MKLLSLVAVCLCAVLLTAGIQNAGGKPVDENLLCRKIEDCYRDVKPLEKQKGKAFDMYVERLSYLILAAGEHAGGSKRLDAIFSKIQKESPTLPVPRYVMTPAELKKFVAAMATDDANDLAYSAYLRKIRYMSQWIDQAKKAITKRSGFKFDPLASVIHAQ